MSCSVRSGVIFRDLEIAQQTGDISGEGNAYGSIGICYAQTGKVDESLVYFKKHLEISQQTGGY